MNTEDALRGVDELDNESFDELFLEFSDFSVSDNGDESDCEDKSYDDDSGDNNGWRSWLATDHVGDHLISIYLMIYCMKVVYKEMSPIF